MSLKDNMDLRIEELLPFYVLDALTDEERELVEAYLSEHPEARAQVQELQSGASALPYGVPPVEPPRHVREALMARIASDERARSQLQSEPSRRVMHLEDLFRFLSLAAATVAILWAFVLNGQVTRLRNEISTLNDRLAAQSESLEQVISTLDQINPSDVVTVSLRGTDVQPGAQGQLIADPNEQSAVLVIAGLPPLEPGRTYQVWLIQGDTPVSAGLLKVDANGQGVLVVTSEAEIGSFDALGISVEPEEGSLQPTGDIVVLSALQ
jgi:anti-sigma-K factor RskA